MRLEKPVTENHHTDPSPTFIPHWSDDLFGRIDDVYDLIVQADQDRPITSIDLARRCNLGWEEVWAIAWRLRSIGVPICNLGCGFWLTETMLETVGNRHAHDNLLSVDRRGENLRDDDGAA